MAALQSLPWLYMAFAVVLAAPAPGRIPKVYNALITSNQNLEPSKAFPVYQPVLHNTFPFPLQTVVYGDLPLTNGLIPVPAAPSKDVNVKPQETPTSIPDGASDVEATEKSVPAPEPSPAPEKDATTTPPVPKTESPIPLNEFGLPPQILPLSRVNPGYQYTQLATYPYTYPGLRLYDPYDPFGLQLQTYANWPLYQPLTNFIGQTLPLNTVRAEGPALSTSVEEKSAQAPPSEPSELNVLNYSAKDPAIPNVPPPPLPQGGLKSDKE
ncbi:unnamed protein product, partial [Brenthis ino]